MRRTRAITSHMQTIIQIYPCLLKLLRKQESVTDGQTDKRTARQTDGLLLLLYPLTAFAG
jgi:DNA-binding ferritin-like protein